MHQRRAVARKPRDLAVILRRLSENAHTGCISVADMQRELVFIQINFPRRFRFKDTAGLRLWTATPPLFVVKFRVF